MKHMRLIISIFVVSGLLTTTAISEDIPDKNERQPDQKELGGYTNSPMLPGGKWHVHDPNRPQPRVVTPNYDGEPVSPPEEAQVLFDGTSLDGWKNKD